MDANELDATAEAVGPQETAVEPLSSASADVSSENKAKADLDKKLSPASEEKRLSLKVVKVGLTKLESLPELKKDSTAAAGDGEEPRTSASPPCEVSSTTLVESTASAVTAVTAVTTVTATATTSNTKTSTSGFATNHILFTFARGKKLPGGQINGLSLGLMMVSGYYQSPMLAQTSIECFKNILQ